jgi:hypothetical protein
MVPPSGGTLLLGVVAVVVASLMGIGGPLSADTGDGDTPGVYIDELPELSAGDFTAEQSVGLFVGSGTATGQPDAGDPLLVTDMADFEARVTDPSAALNSALENYFLHTRAGARVVLSQSEDAASLVSAVGSVTSDVGPALWSVPALGDLSGADYQGVAEALSRAAGASLGMALLDPPDAVVDPLAGGADPDVSALVGLAGILGSVLPSPEHTVLYSTPLVDESDVDGQRVSTAAVMAGEFTLSDESVGQWQAPAGASFRIPGLEPLYDIDNETNGTLDSAGIVAIRTMPSFGTVVWGARTLGEVQGQVGYVSTVRTLDLVTLSIRNGTESLESAPNGPGTWAMARRGASAFLEQLWNEGAFLGSDAAEAFEVQVGVPESMTQDEVTGGVMNIDTGVALVSPSQFFTTQVTVQTAPG